MALCCFETWGTAVLLPDDVTPGVPKHVGRQLCIDCVYFLVKVFKLVR
jgi:hypothetical protein